MAPPKELNFITGNAHKLAEVNAILGDTVVLKSKSVDLPELQGTIEDISRDKCQRAADVIQGPVLVEDTCMSFDAWGELPGPYMLINLDRKWFVKQFGPDGLHTLLAGFDNKSAQAICTFAYCEGPGKQPLLFQGRTTVRLPQANLVDVVADLRVQGKIVPARGPRDFGWDSAFEHEGQTYAEMEKAEKNRVSHRGKALAKLKEWLTEEITVD